MPAKVTEEVRHGELGKDSARGPAGLSHQPSTQQQLKRLCTQRVMHGQAPRFAGQSGETRGFAKPGTRSAEHDLHSLC